MKEFLFALSGLAAGFAITLLHEHLSRLRGFKAKMVGIMIRVQEAKDADLGPLYLEIRLRALEDIALVKSDVPGYKRERFDTASLEFHTLEKKDSARNADRLIRSLYPNAIPFTDDHRSLRQRFEDAIRDLEDCAKY